MTAEPLTVHLSPLKLQTEGIKQARHSGLEGQRDRVQTTQTNSPFKHSFNQSWTRIEHTPRDDLDSLYKYQLPCNSIWRLAFKLGNTQIDR